jgi:hypothetical protein
MKVFLLVSLLFFSSLFSDEPIGLFSPPPGWQCSNPNSLSTHVLVRYIGKKKWFFSPSINLASEKINANLQEYVAAVKKIHDQDKKTSLRELGKIKTHSGEATLLEIRSKSKLGDMRILQSILVKNNYAYIITGATLEKELSKNYKEFIKSFQSLKVVPNLFTVIKNGERQNKLKIKIDSIIKEINTNKLYEKEVIITEKIQDFSNYLTSEFQELGNYWQYLILKKIALEINDFITLQKKSN